MYRDSFGDLLYPYLADCFEEAGFSRSADYDPTQCSADCVVIELVERNLRNLIRNIPKVCAPKAETVPAKNQGQIALTGEPDGLWILWRGTIDNVDLNSQILLEAYGQFYRCFLLENGGFAAMLPVNSIPSAVQYQQDGCWVRMTVTQSGEK